MMHGNSNIKLILMTFIKLCLRDDKSKIQQPSSM